MFSNLLIGINVVVVYFIKVLVIIINDFNMGKVVWCVVNCVINYCIIVKYWVSINCRWIIKFNLKIMGKWFVIKMW